MKSAMYVSYQGIAQYIIVHYKDNTSATYEGDHAAVTSLWEDIAQTFPEGSHYLVNSFLRDYDDSDWFTLTLIAPDID